MNKNKNTDFFEIKNHNGKRVLTNLDRSKVYPYGTEEEIEKTENVLKDKGHEKI